MKAAQCRVRGEVESEGRMMQNAECRVQGERSKVKAAGCRVHFRQRQPLNEYSRNLMTRNPWRHLGFFLAHAKNASFIFDPNIKVREPPRNFDRVKGAWCRVQGARQSEG